MFSWKHGAVAPLHVLMGLADAMDLAPQNEVETKLDTTGIQQLKTASNRALPVVAALGELFQIGNYSRAGLIIRILSI